MTARTWRQGTPRLVGPAPGSSVGCPRFCVLFGWSIGCLVAWFLAWLVDAGGAVCIVCLFGNLFGVL